MERSKEKGNLNFLGQENTNLNKLVSRPIYNFNDNQHDISNILRLLSLYAN